MTDETVAKVSKIISEFMLEVSKGQLERYEDGHFEDYDYIWKFHPDELARKVIDVSGNNIIEGLSAAAQQDVTRVDIAGQTWVRKVGGFKDDGKFDGDFDRLRKMAQEHIESGELVLVTPQLMLQLIDLAEGKA